MATSLLSFRSVSPVSVPGAAKRTKSARFRDRGRTAVKRDEFISHWVPPLYRRLQNGRLHSVHLLWRRQARDCALGCAGRAHHAEDSGTHLCTDCSPALAVFALMLNFVADGREAPHGRCHEQGHQNESLTAHAGPNHQYVCIGPRDGHPNPRRDGYAHPRCSCSRSASKHMALVVDIKRQVSGRGSRALSHPSPE
jgi:hypothetical protein